MSRGERGERGESRREGGGVIGRGREGFLEVLRREHELVHAQLRKLRRCEKTEREN